MMWMTLISWMNVQYDKIPKHTKLNNGVEACIHWQEDYKEKGGSCGVTGRTCGEGVDL